MPLFKRHGPVGASDVPDGPEPPTRLLPAAALLQYADDEIWRAGRYGRPLVVVCLRPQLLPGEEMAPDELQHAAQQLASRLRRSDRAAVLDGRLVAVLPETDGPTAHVVAHRLAADLTVQSAGLRRRTWRYGLASLPEGGCTNEELLQAAGEDAD